MWLKARESLALEPPMEAQIDAEAAYCIVLCNNNSNVVISVAIIT